MKLRLAGTLLLSALALASAAGCEKSSSSGGAASGALNASEKDLLTHLPKGGIGILGGNMFQAQKWMESSPLSKMTAQMSPPEMLAWNTCLAKEMSTFTMVGSVAMAGDAPVVRLFIKDAKIPMFEKCAKEAGLNGTLDPDGKVFTVELKSAKDVTLMAPYLAVDGGVYSQVQTAGMGAALGGGGRVTAATRADLEKDVASLKDGTAAEDPRFASLLTKVDRKQTMWFVGTAEGTKLDDKLGMVYGGMSIESGLRLNGTAQLKDPSDVDNAIKQFDEMKANLDKMPPQMAALKDAIKKISLSKADGGLRVSMDLSNEQLEQIGKALAPMLGGLR